MNVKNNKRRQQSREKIEKEFILLLQTKEITEISVSDICKRTALNRSTFYANYEDIYDLANTIKRNLEEEVKQVYAEEWAQKNHSHDFLKLFYHIKENPIFYKTYFKLDFDQSFQSVFYDPEILKEWFPTKNLDYHVTFFKAGLNAILQTWLKNGCAESPEEMNEILKEEYKGRMD